jgi:hypothetical protein
MEGCVKGSPVEEAEARGGEGAGRVQVPVEEALGRSLGLGPGLAHGSVNRGHVVQERVRGRQRRCGIGRRERGRREVERGKGGRVEKEGRGGAVLQFLFVVEKVRHQRCCCFHTNLAVRPTQVRNGSSLLRAGSGSVSMGRIRIRILKYGKPPAPN